MAKKMKMYPFEEILDEQFGKIGTPRRDQFEHEVNMGVMGYMIKTARKKRNLTQEQLGELVGVQKAQISKLENSANSATLDTITKVFKALKAEIRFTVKLDNEFLQLI
jgi:HTH-type transcriptional regulator / antitoxin HipB